jgi:hypothetical protein
MYSYEHSVDLLFKIYCSIVVRRMYERYSPWKSLEHKSMEVDRTPKLDPDPYES